MDWTSTLQDAGVIAAASTAIFFVIDFIKKLYYKLPWGWIQKTPGEVWFALSIAFGIGIAVILFWNSFFGADASLSGGLASTAYGLVSGAGSKFINSLASTAGARLKASKEEALAKTATITNGKKEESKPIDTPLGETVQTPVYTESATPSMEERIQETKQRIEEQIKQTIFVISPEGEIVKFDHMPSEDEIKESFPSVPVVEIVKKMTPEGDYVIINGTVYKLTKEG